MTSAPEPEGGNSLQYRTLPGTDLTVSAIALGTGNLGSALDSAASFHLLDRFVDHGGTFLDSARVYAAWIPGGMGISERTIGQWLRLRKHASAMVIGTKGGHPDLDTMNVPRLDRAHIISDCENSLRDLECDAIGLYWLHRDDETRPVDDMLETLESLVTAGKIRVYGCSNWTPIRMQAAREAAQMHHYQGFVANQPMWSLATINPGAIVDPTMKWMDAAMRTFHRSTSMAVVPYTAQAHGFFTKAAAGIAALPEDLRRAYDNPSNLQQLGRLQHWAAQLQQSVGALALAYLISQPDFITIPVIGANHPWQLEESLSAADLTLSAEIFQDLDRPFESKASAGNPNDRVSG